MGIDVQGFKEGQKAMWTAGDYPEVARRIASVGALVAERAGAAPGVELLDVATGAGNVSLQAAQAGAKVTGLDLTPKLLQVQRERAAEAGLQVELLEGDAEDLPFPDGSFDRVTSCFGVMFAPRHRVAAEQLVRVARPGGRIVVTAWTPTSYVGRTFQAAGKYMPPPPPGFEPPPLWGVEQHVRDLFEGTGVEVTCEKHTVRFTGPTPEQWLADDERLLGPAVMAKAALEPQGLYESLRADLLALLDELNEAQDGSFAVEGEYLLTVASKPA